MGQTAQSLTCSIMEKPHTGLDDCLRILLSCFRARNCGSHILPACQGAERARDPLQGLSGFSQTVGIRHLFAIIPMPCLGLQRGRAEKDIGYGICSHGSKLHTLLEVKFNQNFHLWYCKWVSLKSFTHCEQMVLIQCSPVVRSAVLSNKNWQYMQADLTSRYGRFWLGVWDQPKIDLTTGKTLHPLTLQEGYTVLHEIIFLMKTTGIQF